MADSTEDDDFQNKSDIFIQWLKDNGATISPKIELADLRQNGAGRGVRAMEDIAEDEELFSIPRTAILDVTTSSLPDALRRKLDDPWLSLILAMIREYGLGESSRFKPYVDVLPATLDTLMYWTENELYYLTGSAVLDKIGKESADAIFAEQVVPSIRQNLDLFNAGAISDDDLIGLCHRMGSLIMAYAFDLEKSTPPAESVEEEWEEDNESEAEMPKGMIPLADMLNADADRNNAKLFYEDDTKVVMRAIKPVRKGEELFNDYGPLPRADVLRRYGYITDNYAKHDVVEVSLQLIKHTAIQELEVSEQSLDGRIDYLGEHGMEESSFDIARPDNEDGQFPDELRVLLNTMAITAPEFEKIKSKDKLSKPELSEKALELLYSVLERRAKMYPSENTTSNHADISSGNGADEQVERRPTMAIAVIEGEKQVLREAMETVQALLQPADDSKRKADTIDEEAGSLQGSSKKQKAGCMR
jgi:SET domain-containing protein 6